MIVIEITNIDQLIKDKKGPLASLVGPWITDIEGQIERRLIEEVRQALERNGVKANILSVSGVKLRYIDSVG